MILLDTNVISETMRSTPAPAVRRWLDEQATETLYLSSVTVAELRFGLGVLSDGRRKRALATTLNGVFALFEGRILSFDADAARSYADLAVAARQAGKGFPVPDGLHRRDRCRQWLQHCNARSQRLRGGGSCCDRSMACWARIVTPSAMP